MAYARLDVFWPDGRFESFPLETPTVSVGRSTGNTVTLDTDTISRYHISIMRQGDEVTISDMDSANGTFVDGVRLQDNEARALGGGEEIQIGHLRMIYHTLDEQPTIPMETVEDDTQRIERATADFRADIYGPPIAVPPGSYTSVELSITSTADEPRRFAVDVSGMPEEWLRVNRPTLEIDPGDTTTVLINIKPLRRSESAPGDYPLKVTVTPEHAPENQVELNLTARILPYAGFGVALANPRLSHGDSFRLHLHNQGSLPIPLTVSGRQRGDKLVFGIPMPQLTLAPGQRTMIQGEVKPKKPRYFGAPASYSFDLVVQSHDEAGFLTAVPGHFNEQPILPAWAAATVAALMALVAVLGVIAVILLLPSTPPEPEIVTFSTGAEQVAQGDSFIVSWESENVERYRLLIAGNLIDGNIAGTATGYEIDTSLYEGDVTVLLEAYNEERLDTASLSVNIFRALDVQSFDATPAPLVRNVVQTLTVNWRVNGAILTRLGGISALEGVNSGELQAGYGAEASVVVTGIPLEPLTLTLFAEDAEGRTLQDTLTVEVVDPTCVTAATVPMRDLPGETAREIGTLNPNTTLVIDRRDPSAGWVRTALSTGEAGWVAVDNLTCGANFMLADLRVDSTVSVPSPAPTVTVTPVIITPGAARPADPTATPGG